MKTLSTEKVINDLRDLLNSDDIYYPEISNIEIERLRHELIKLRITELINNYMVYKD